MIKKFLHTVLPVIILIFGMTVIGCDNGSTNGDKDTWSKVTTLSQIDGTWKVLSDTVSVNSIDLGSDAAEYYGNMKLIYKYTNYTVTFNSDENTMLISGSATTTYSGGNIITLWPGIKESIEYLNQSENVTASANDLNYSLTMTYNNFLQEIDDEVIGYSFNVFQINQDRSKLKMGTVNINVIYIKQ